jgi:hypothetical protein
MTRTTKGDRDGELFIPELGLYTMDREPVTGLNAAWYTNLLQNFPLLQNKEGEFHIAQLRMDGAICYWYDDIDEAGDCWSTETAFDEIPVIPWLPAMLILSKRYGAGFLCLVYPAGQDMTEQLEYTRKAMKAKNYTEMLQVIADAGIIQVEGRTLTDVDELWKSLPKHFIPTLSAWYAQALEVTNVR